MPLLRDQPQEPAARVEALLGQVEEIADPAAREIASEAIAALVALYGEGLDRILERGGSELAAELAEDELVGHLMLVHDLHPSRLDERIEAALAEVRPYLESHGGGVELVAVDGETVRLRLQGSCSGCPSSTMTLKLAVEDAIRKHAPEIATVEAEGEDQPPAPQLLQVENVRAAAPNGSANGATDRGAEAAWHAVGELPQLREPGTLAKLVDGEQLLFVGVASDRYAYRCTCPACESSLEGATLTGAELRCADCGRAYDVRRAGRCLDAPKLHLEPVPLLVGDSGIARVALGAPR